MLTFRVTYCQPYDALDKPARVVILVAANKRAAEQQLRTFAPNAERVTVKKVS